MIRERKARQMTMASVNTTEDRRGEKALGVLFCSLLGLTRLNSLFNCNYFVSVRLSLPPSHCQVFADPQEQTNTHTEKIYINISVFF